MHLGEPRCVGTEFCIAFDGTESQEVHLGLGEGVVLSHSAPNLFQAGVLFFRISFLRRAGENWAMMSSILSSWMFFLNRCLSISGSNIGSVVIESTIGDEFALPTECAMKVKNS